VVTTISPMLAVRDASAAIDFYVRAFGAVERWRIAVRARALAAGATAGSPVEEPTHETTGPRPVRMLQGGVRDPLGHTWLIGRLLA
jgi:uncharacterized glyoxalase superfamily protein PhnB